MPGLPRLGVSERRGPVRFDRAVSGRFRRSARGGRSSASQASGLPNAEFRSRHVFRERHSDETGSAVRPGVFVVLREGVENLMPRCLRSDEHVGRGLEGRLVDQ
jgi:hypothetical protein